MPVLEAMSVGLPIVVSEGGSTDDFVPYFRFENFQPFIQTTLVHATAESESLSGWYV